MCDGDDCCKRISKFLLVVINLFFFLLGMLMLAFGIAMVVAPDKVAKAVKDTGADLSVLGDANYIIKASGVFMIVLGAIILLIGAFGFFGACCENKMLLVLYLIFVILILLAEVALIIFAACFPTNLSGWVKEEMNKTLIKNFTQDVRIYPNVTLGSDYATGYSWAVTQFGAKCCGATNPSDYANQDRYPEDKRKIQWNSTSTITAKYPISCCKLNGGVTFENIKDESSFVNFQGCITGTDTKAFNDKNCYDAIETMIVQASRIAIGVAAAIVGFQVIIVVLGFILCCAIQGKSFTV